MIHDVDARVRRRCGETVASILEVVDSLDLARRDRQALRRRVMAAIHSQGDDTAALIVGLDDDDSEFTEDWLRTVGFGLGPGDPSMHAAVVATSEDGDDGRSGSPPPPR